MTGKTFQPNLDVFNVLSVILGGGRGTRLFPLTQDRANRLFRSRANTGLWISPFRTALILATVGFIS